MQPPWFNGSASCTAVCYSSHDKNSYIYSFLQFCWGLFVDTAWTSFVRKKVMYCCIRVTTGDGSWLSEKTSEKNSRTVGQGPSPVVPLCPCPCLSSVKYIAESFQNWPGIFRSLQLGGTKSGVIYYSNSPMYWDNDPPSIILTDIVDNVTIIWIN